MFFKTAQIVIALLIFTCSASATDNASGAPKIKLKEEQIKAWAKNYNIDPGSQIYREFREAIRTGKAVTLKANKTKSLGDLKVLKHIKGSLGIPLPTEKELTPAHLPSKEELKEMIKTEMPKMHQAAMDSFIAPKLKKCKAPKTESRQLGPKKEGANARVFYDFVYLTNDQKHNIKEGALGKEVILMTYKGGEKDPESLSAASAGAYCLPFRIRRTESHIYRLHGAAALKNYEREAELSTESLLKDIDKLKE